MSNKTIRIRTTPNGSDNYVKVNLEQDFDIIEILSLKITQEEAYRTFCSDYGVVAGRVIVNSGFGVPNAKVSIFIPIDDVDRNNPEIKDLYPYEVVSDKDNNGVRYNLLAKCAESDNDCFTPIGTFPSKREVLDNENMSYIYCKYYKFTCTTNHAGDFMIFGVPLGYYTLHVDVDVSDIGILSQRPYDAISQGAPQKLFRNPNKYKGGNNLDSLVQVKSANVGVNVQPFWGDKDSCQIGISRVDVDLNTTIVPCAMFMGGIFGDQDKNSVNKRCRPRKDMGNLCDQVVSEGTIEMIRKTIDGEIESFDVDGGRVIDENGSWAYQIPMNLDYVVTDEEGNLIPSPDPNIGIATRSSVRFRIGMDQTGGEGRLRTRAKYLVPNNPSTTGEIDYEFGELTKPSSFKNIYWNKIYSVKNFISRFQTTNDGTTKQRISIKDVDDCVGNKNPFPYNKLTTNQNPLFFVICMIIKIIAFIIWVMNKVIIPIINFIITLLNGVLSIICNIIWGFGQFIASFPSWLVGDVDICGKFCINKDSCCDCGSILDYVPCIYVKCPSDEEGYNYAPGCNPDSKGFTEANNTGNPLTYYPNDSYGHSGQLANGEYDVGLSECMSFSIAEALNIYQFDFYNDWINGSLYSFLLKYKKKRRNTEKFCEYDCEDFGIASGGVDGNNNGVPDNNCHNNFLVDTGVYSPLNLDSHEAFVSKLVREGLIKKYKNEFYYAATTHNAAYKLFATDLIFLGSVFECDWQGIPKIQQYLTPTTYILPPPTQELTETGEVDVTGQIETDGNTKGLFFNINCRGLHSNPAQVLNIRHICEFGVELDELRDIDNVSVAPDGIIGSNDIDGDYGNFFRNVFYGLNNSTTSTPSSWLTNYSAYNTKFNLLNKPEYNFAGVQNYPSPTTGANGAQYLQFRGFQTGANTSYSQPKNSFYFYFGLIPGATGLDRLNQRFFNTCEPEAPCLINLCEQYFVVIDSTTPATTATAANGKVIFHIDGGTGPFSYTITGPTTPPAGTVGVAGANVSTNKVTISNLKAGTYTIKATDANNCFITQNFTIGKPGPLYATAVVTQCTTSSANDGKITIDNIGGGTGPYSFKLYKHNGTQVSVGGSLNWVTCTQGHVITGLGEDYLSDGATPVPHNGYKLIVKDSNNTQVTIYDLVIDCVTLPTITPKKTNVTCCDGSDGKINLVINGGTSPFTITTTGPNNYQSGVLNMSGLTQGTYVTTIVDALGYTTSSTNVLTELHACMNLVYVPTPQCDPTKYILKYKITSGFAAGNAITFQKNINNQTANGQLVYTNITPSQTYNSATQIFTLQFPASELSGNATSIRIRVKSVDGKCFSNAIVHNGMDIALPPNVLTIYENDNFGFNTNIDNSVQQVENQFTFKFNISHFTVNNSRAPYTLIYQIKAFSEENGGGNSVLGPTITGDTNIQTEIETAYVGYNAVVPQVNGEPAKSCIAYLTVIDSKGCTANYTMGPYDIVPKPDELTLTVTKKDVTCCGAEDGAINIVVDGGTPLFTCTLTNTDGYSNVKTNAVSPISFGNLPISDYTITVTDSNGLQKQETLSIILNPENGSPCLKMNIVSVPECLTNQIKYKYTIDGITNNILGSNFRVQYSVNNGDWIDSLYGGTIQTINPSNTYPFEIDLTTLPYEIGSITSIKFRISVDGSACPNPYIELTPNSPYFPPATPLTANFDSTQTTQLNDGSVQFKLTIPEVVTNPNNGPYTLEYTCQYGSGIEQLTGINNGEVNGVVNGITTQVTTINVPVPQTLPTGDYTNACAISYTVTNSIGCSYSGRWGYIYLN